ncbi:glycoside hydrolase family 6 protein [Paenibacillus sp. FSL H7-0323]|uniref:glycoside hydrolase family 6 protein n=1 Tax=Paenibacillus sp. FSL H7-0323 TaxID=2921433 RepID=UPI004048ACA4
MTKALRKQMLLLLTIMALVITGYAPSTTYASEAHVDNPFVGATAYVNPDYAALIDTSIAQVTDSTLVSKMETIKKYPTAVWLDRIAAIYGGTENGGRKSLEETLDSVLAQKQPNTPITATFVIYDMPGRDCHALASNGELPLTAAGLTTYKSDYVDVIASIFAKPKYSDIRIVTIVEPDSLPNLVTNLSTPQCAQANSTNIYRDATRYTLNALHAIPNVYTYMDIGHSGWLGWDTNRGPAIDLFTSVVSGTTAGLASVDGFITNTANTTPLVEPNLPDPNLTIGSQQLRSASYYEWNPYFDEADFTAALYSGFVAKGWPSTIGFLIDTSRNGWGGANRPTSASGTTVNAYADSGRIDKRLHRGNWCNASGAGIGEVPQAAPAGYAASHLDAFVWVKPPGESDGSSSAIPNNEGKGFDRMCDPTYTSSSGTLTGALPNAPVSGHWFHDQFVQLVQNAYPVIPLSNGGGTVVPAAPTNLVATAGDAKVSLSWTASSSATSYTVKRATTSGGPYTTVATGLTATSYTNTGLTNGTTYYYVVSATNSVGESVNSGQANATPAAVATVPTAPTNLVATAGDAKVNLSWSASNGATSYTVKSATTSGGPYTTVAAGLTTTSYTNTALTNGATYYYVVSATNSVGESADSTQASAAPAAVATVPAAPTNLVATAGDAKVNLSWSASSGATSYTVKSATTSGGPYTTVATGLTATSYINTGLTNGTTYYYVVSATNSAGESVNSAQASAVPQVPAAISLTLQYRAGDTNATDNQIKPYFNIKNNGTTAVNLSELKIRYYFTKDSNQTLNGTIDWAQIGNNNVQVAFADNTGTNADTYVELSFASSAGSIPAGGQSGDIQLRIYKSDWTNFNEANDYSFDATKTAYTNWDKVTLYQSDALVWGIAP